MMFRHPALAVGSYSITADQLPELSELRQREVFSSFYRGVCHPV